MWSSWVFGSSRFAFGRDRPIKKGHPKERRAPIGWGLPGIILVNWFYFLKWSWHKTSISLERFESFVGPAPMLVNKEMPDMMNIGVLKCFLT